MPVKMLSAERDPFCSGLHVFHWLQWISNLDDHSSSMTLIRFWTCIYIKIQYKNGVLTTWKIPWWSQDCLMSHKTILSSVGWFPILVRQKHYFEMDTTTVVIVSSKIIQMVKERNYEQTISIKFEIWSETFWLDLKFHQHFVCETNTSRNNYPWKWLSDTNSVIHCMFPV